MGSTVTREAEALSVLDVRLRSRLGERLVHGAFRVDPTKSQEFARALLRRTTAEAVPTTFYEAFRLQLSGPDWSGILGLDPRRMLHGEQEVAVHEPLTVGDIVDVSTELTDVRPVRGRRGGDMLLLTLASYFSAETSGATKLEAVRRILVITAAPDGTPTPTSPGRWDGECRLRPLELADVVRYAGASGDFNPIHYDRDLARARGNPDVFAQGMLGAGIVAETAASVMSTAPRRFHFRFRDRVWLGRPLEVVWRSEAGTGSWTFVLRDDESDKVVATIAPLLTD